jgi:MOSC domain-containing protein YiiM
MRACPEVTAVAGVGLEGDRYAQGTGCFSDGGGPGRHLTLIASEDVEAASAELPEPLRPADTRRNVVTGGVDLTALLGRRFRIGEVTCVAIRTCPPCTYLDGLLGRRVLDALTGLGGIRADIVTGGIIRVGDEIVLLDQSAASDRIDGTGL